MEGKGQDIAINIEHLNKQFLVDKQPIEVLRDINLQVKKGEFVTIVGHSGCGKSTLLKIICGLVDYEDGVVERNGHAVAGPGPKCGMVFQDHRLLPWLKIKDNVGFGLKHLPKEERNKKVREHLELVGLEGFENSYPSQLSGGMSQRAAIARGLAGNPTILLLDHMGINFDGSKALSLDESFWIRVLPDRNGKEEEYHRIHIYKGTLLHVQAASNERKPEEPVVAVTQEELYLLAVGTYDRSRRQEDARAERILDLLEKYIVDIGEYRNFNLIEPVAEE